MKGINFVTVTRIWKSLFSQDLCRQRMAGKSNEKPAPTGPVPGPSGTSSSSGKKKGAVGFVDKVEQKNGHPSSSSESSSSGGAGHGSRSSTSSWFVIQIHLLFLPPTLCLSLSVDVLVQFNLFHHRYCGIDRMDRTHFPLLLCANLVTHHLPHVSL